MSGFAAVEGVGNARTQMGERPHTARPVLAVIIASRYHGSMPTWTSVTALVHTLTDDDGLDVWSRSMLKIRPEGDWIYHPLWGLWGGLTDWVEHKPAETAQAAAAMVEATQEFLRVSEDEERERAYFDHWLLERIGYARSADGELQALRPSVEGGDDLPHQQP